MADARGMPDRLPNISAGLPFRILCSEAHACPTCPSWPQWSARLRGRVSAPGGSLVALLDEGVPVRTHTPLPANTPRSGAAAAARDGRLKSQPGPHQRCLLPISLRRLPAHLAPPLLPLLTRDSVVSLTTQLHSSRVVALAALGIDQAGSPFPQGIVKTRAVDAFEKRGFISGHARS